MISNITVANSFCIATRSTTLPHGIDIVPCGFLLSENKKNTESSQFGFTKPLSKNLGDIIE